MRWGRLIDAQTGRVLAGRAALAETFWDQLQGRIGRENAWSAVPLGLPRCPQVHTAFLRTSLTVAFCDAEGRVLQVVTVPPWRISPFVRGVAVAWEALAGSGALSGVEPGDVLRWEVE